jgi:hypothetical protein
MMLRSNGLKLSEAVVSGRGALAAGKPHSSRVVGLDGVQIFWEAEQHVVASTFVRLRPDALHSSRGY